MRPDIVIPKELAHLKLDDRGYPIPFFAPIVDKKVNFRFADKDKIATCMKRRLCGICGKKLPKDYCYNVTGPLGLKNRIGSDAMMHEVCARFSMMACPHMYYQRAERKEGSSSIMAPGKPDEILLVKVSNWKTQWQAIQVKDKTGKVVGDNVQLFRYTPVSYVRFIYENNVLVEQEGVVKI